MGWRVRAFKVICFLADFVLVSVLLFAVATVLFVTWNALLVKHGFESMDFTKSLVMALCSLFCWDKASESVKDVFKEMGVE